jgi:hypothetical protein
MQPVALAFLCLAVVIGWPRAASADRLTNVVKAACLSAFENEISQSGKSAPPGMADFACDCVAQRIRVGGGIEAARNACKEATAQRYPI